MKFYVFRATISTVKLTRRKTRNFPCHRCLHYDNEI